MLLAAWLLVLAPQAAGQGGLYGTVVTRALGRAQAQLAASTKFEVDHSRWEDPWIVRTEHYEVRTTRSYAQAASLAKSLEFMRVEFEKLLGPAPAREGRHAVWIMPDLAAYNQKGESAGDHSSLLGSFHAVEFPERPVVALQSRNATELGMWVTHSATHQYVASAFGERAPTWVAEGLASYFALYWDWNYGAEELARQAKAGRLLPLERLFAEPLPAYRADPHVRFLQLGMLFHFLLNSCEATRNGATGDPETGPFREFLRLAVRGEDTRRTDFAESLEGTLDLLQAEFEEHEFEFK
jgi:hypothetical protein